MLCIAMRPKKLTFTIKNSDVVDFIRSNFHKLQARVLLKINVHNVDKPSNEMSVRWQVGPVHTRLLHCLNDDLVDIHANAKSSQLVDNDGQLAG